MRARGLAVAIALLAPLAAPASVAARVMLVATGTPELAFVDVSTRAVAARLALPGPSHAVAITSDGQRGYVAAGGEVVSVDVNARTELGRSALGPGLPEISDVELSSDGATLYLVQGRRLVALDPLTLMLRSEVGLNGDGTRLALDSSGRAAAVVLTNGRVAMLSTERNVLLRQVKLKGAVDVAIDRAGRTLVSARGRLWTIAPGQRRARKHALALPPGAGGGLTLSAGGSRLVVGAAPGGASAALVDLRGGRVQRLAAGRGPGWPAWNLDSTRILMADSGGGSVSLVSPFSRARVGTVRLPGATPVDLVVQPGIASLIGTDGPDVITGTRGADRIEGLGGADLLRGGRAQDSLDGGAGDDRLSGGASNDALSGGDDNDFLLGGAGDDKIDGGAGIDGADGGTGNDVIDGGPGDDTLDGGDGDDTILAGPGNDHIEEKGFGNDKRLNGGPGDDYISGGRGSDRIIEGEDGNDKLYGGPGKETISGGRGDDLLDGGRAADDLRGDEGADQLRGDAGNDALDGGEGDDSLDGGSGADAIAGGAGNDMITAGPGPDTITGGDGNDVIRAADDSADSVDCGAGYDSVFVEADSPQRDQLLNCEVMQTIPPEAANDTDPPSLFFGSAQPEFIAGTSDDDSILGNGGNDRLFAGAGDDYVDGGRGNDEMHGGAGSDIMAGRRGDDEIYGGAGDDRITGDRGNDRIFGGDGSDTIFGNLDADRVDGGPGDDRINVAHGGHDAVVCGSGKDVVFADSTDAVSKDCESVRR